MRGSPLLQAILVIVAFALAGVPVWRLTLPAATVGAPMGTGPSIDPVLSHVTLLDMEAVFAPAPVDFQVSYLDATVFDGQGPQTQFTTRWKAFLKSEGADLVVRARWPVPAAGGAPPAAMRVTVNFPDGRTVEKSFWAAANGTLADVFTVPGVP